MTARKESHLPILRACHGQTTLDSLGTDTAEGEFKSESEASSGATNKLLVGQP